MRKCAELREYNGWENKFTWLVGLHLGNDAVLFETTASLVAREADDGAAGRQVEKWVTSALLNWLTCFAGRNMSFDGNLRLLAWDLIGSAFGHVDWDDLVKLLLGETIPLDNPFVGTLYRNILMHGVFQQEVSVVMNTVVNTYVCADAIKDWFSVQLDAWVSVSGSRRQRNVPMVMLVQELLQDTYTVIAWEHVARAFRPD